MDEILKPATRRRVLIGAATLAALPLVATPIAAQAGTTPKTTVKYQDHPNGANACAKCLYFQPGAKAAGPGQCKLVAGAISPTGWCIMYAPKPR